MVAAGEFLNTPQRSVLSIRLLLFISIQIKVAQLHTCLAGRYLLRMVDYRQ